MKLRHARGLVKRSWRAGSINGQMPRCSSSISACGAPLCAVACAAGPSRSASGSLIAPLPKPPHASAGQADIQLIFFCKLNLT